MTPGILVSYHYVRERPPGKLPQWMELWEGHPVILDSGAYSAWTKGSQIPLLAFSRFIREHGPRFHWVASLDVIGNPEATRRNWDALRRSWPVVPTVHLLTDLRFLDYYLGHGVDRVAIGGMVGNRDVAKVGSQVHGWIREALSRCHARGVRVHGFGLQSRRTVGAHPWDSVDATSAVQNAMWRKVVARDGDRIREATPEDVPPDLRRRLWDHYEVAPGVSHGRRHRVRWNVEQYCYHLESTGISGLFHALNPNGRDEEEIVRGIVNYRNGVNR